MDTTQEHYIMQYTLKDHAHALTHTEGAHSPNCKQWDLLRISAGQA
jgi:hypothetical protein